jgi:hypothetical protein
MILVIEGARHSGKTFLIEKFFEQNKNPKVHYYKFQFAKYIDDLGMRDQETGPGVHYFSIANVLTILELNQSLLKDKIVIFDRSIFSAYTWSILRKRMEENILPHQNSIETGNIEEERRLAYVGITRAQRSLTFSYCTHRKRYGEISECEPSRFLGELPADDLEWVSKKKLDPHEQKQRGKANLAHLKTMLS